MDIEKYLIETNEDLSELGKRVALSYWKLATEGKGEYGKDLEQAEIDLRMYLSSRERFEIIKEAFTLDCDEKCKRQIKLLFNSMLPNQLPKESIEKVVKKEVEMEGIYANFRGKIDGKEVTNNEITKILSESFDHELRKKAWIAGKEMGKEIYPRLVELIKLRNENAKFLGFDNYYDMMMELQELSTEQIISMFTEIKRQTDDVFVEIKRDIDTTLAEKFNIPRDEIAPWHYSDLWFQEIPEIDRTDYNEFFKDKDIVELASKTYDMIGLEIRDIINRSDLYERKGKNQHAFTIGIDRQGDVRVLENIKPNVKWMETTLHEYGHAVYEKYIEKELPYILREPAHIFTTEAVAMFFGRLARNPEWYGKVLEIPQSKLSGIEKSLLKLLRYQLAITTRWVITFVLFEKELYRNPEGDLNNLWYDIVHEVQYVNTPKERRSFPDWAAKIHFGTAPVYYHNYLLGEITASQFEKFIKTNISNNILNKKSGEFFVEQIFKPGSLKKWDVLIEEATGETLSPKYLEEHIKEML